ncbi:MAG: HEAT repeat domain-containing protein [Planctomycetota bacterium]|nr:HEAT repeat domain-containing protein [Planctomycetota bacterium]
MTLVRALLLMIFGAVVGVLVTFAVTGDDSKGRVDRQVESRIEHSTVVLEDDGLADLAAENERLLALVAQLRARLGETPEGDVIWVEDSLDEINLLIEEAYRDTNVDWLLDAIERLLLMGPRGYTRLRSLILELIFKGRMLATGADFRFDQLYRVTHIGMKHEKKFIGFLNFLLIDEETPAMMRQGAAVASAYYVGSKAPGAEELQQTLLQMMLNDAGAGMAPSGMGNMGKRIQLFAMTMSGDPAMITPLREELKNTEDKRMQGDIIGALAYLGDPQALPLIEERLDPSQGKHYKELESLGRIGTPAAHKAATDFLKAIPDTKRFLQHSRRYLQNGGGTDAVMLMQERIRTEPGNSEVASVIGSLQRFPTKESKQTLDLIAETSPDEKVRARALSAAEAVDQKLKGIIPEVPRPRGRRPS